MAAFNSISAALRLTLDAGTEGDKQISKNVLLANINESVSADSLSAIANALGGLLEYPIMMVRKYSASLLVK